MGLARDLVALEEILRTVGVDPFAPINRSDLLEAPLASDLTTQIEKELGVDRPESVMRLCLQALRVQHSELVPRVIEVELAATLPPEVPALVRPTRQIVHEMLRSPVDEVILLGYELNDYNLIRILVDAATNGAEVIIICDRERGSAERILSAWSSTARPPRLFHDRKFEKAAPFASMHAKCLLVDSKELLITSANFTFHGLSGNIEIGVRLSGPPVIEARKIFSYLIERRVVEEVGL